MFGTRILGIFDVYRPSYPSLSECMRIVVCFIIKYVMLRQNAHTVLPLKYSWHTGKETQISPTAYLVTLIVKAVSNKRKHYSRPWSNRDIIQPSPTVCICSGMYWTERKPRKYSFFYVHVRPLVVIKCLSLVRTGTGVSDRMVSDNCNITFFWFRGKMTNIFDTRLIV